MSSVSRRLRVRVARVVTFTLLDFFYLLFAMSGDDEPPPNVNDPIWGDCE